MKKHSTSLRVRLPVFVFVMEVVILALFAAFVTYDHHANAKLHNNETNPMDNAVYRDYPFFTDIQVMIFLLLLSFVSTALEGWSLTSSLLPSPSSGPF